jgi:uncharacterized protein (UPF0305 family)
MANIQRLTKRVNDLEKWITENEATGGPQGVLDTFIFLLNGMKMAQNQTEGINNQIQQLRRLSFEFIEQHELTEEWNEFIQEKENAVQEQQTEEVPLQEEAESGEEAVKAPKEEVKD